MPASYGPYGPRRPMRQEDVILEANAANPDFAIPGGGLGRGGGRGRGRGGRGGMPPPSATMANAGLGNQGRLVNLFRVFCIRSKLTMRLRCRYPGASAI